MDELVSVMEEIRDLLSEMNDKLDDISSEISGIKGNSLRNNNLVDVCKKLDDINNDVCSKLSDIDFTCSMLN